MPGSRYLATELATGSTTCLLSKRLTASVALHGQVMGCGFVPGRVVLAVGGAVTRAVLEGHRLQRRSRLRRGCVRDAQVSARSDWCCSGAAQRGSHCHGSA